MPTIDHESLVELFRNRPRLAAELIRDALGFELPHFDDVASDSIEFNQIKPAEYRCDHVAVLAATGTPVLGIIVEVQRKPDDGKLLTWPVYSTDLRRRLGCDAGVLVIATNDAVAHWASAPIRLGFGNEFRPLVIGPDGVPVILDPDRARSAPELAVLSAVAHGSDQDTDKAVQIAFAAATAVRALPEDQQALYLDMILAALSVAARKALQMLPQGYQFQSDVGRSGQLKGEALGKAASVIDVLEARDLTVTDEQRERIMACTDLDTLRTWVRRAATVASTDELFADEAK